MKTLHLSIIIISLFCFASIFLYAKGDSIYPNPDPIRDPFSKSDIVLVGQVLNLTKIFSANQTEYSITVNFYLKNPKPFGLITVIGDGIKPDKITNYDEVLYYNEPVFTKDEKVFLYLDEENGKYKILPYSFGINTRVGGPPPEVIKFTSFKNTFYGNEPITISGIIQKGFMANPPDKGNSILTIDVHNPNRELYLSDNIPVNVDGTFKYSFKIKGELGIPGSYEYGLNLFGVTGSSFEYLPNPLKQFKSGITVNDVKCKENLQLIIKSENSSPACVKPDTAKKLVERGWGMAVTTYTQQNIPALSSSIIVPNTNFTINYDFVGNGKILDANMDTQSKSLILSLETTSNGTLTVSIPRALLDIKKNDRGMGEFHMLADGQETIFKEINTTPTDRIFSIPFQNGTKNVEIIATELI